MTVPTARPSLHSLAFWVRRYLPGEVAGTAALLLVGLPTLDRTGSVVGTAIAATIAESVAFYAVALGRIGAEQRRTGARGRALVLRTVGLGLAEFGPAEVLDTLLVRPCALWVGTTVAPQAALGLLAGKVVADLVFYAVAASSYRVTDRAGWGARATVDGVSADAGKADGLHVAAHGRHHAERPLFSWLDLADGPWFGYDAERLPRTPPAWWCCRRVRRSDGGPVGRGDRRSGPGRSDRRSPDHPRLLRIGVLTRSFFQAALSALAPAGCLPVSAV